MKMENVNIVSSRVEEIFAHGVALEQSGRLRSTIYVIDREVYILNQDYTVFLRFTLRDTETPFQHPVSFRANDYESKRFKEENGKIIFETEAEGFKRTKSCSSPDQTPEEVRKHFREYKPIKENVIHLSKGLLSLLDENLSHIEIRAEGGKVFFVQRNIYSGAVIEVSRGEEGLLTTDEITSDFGPIGIRTSDFIAMFSFLDNISFSFNPDAGDYCCLRSRDPRMKMDGIIAQCLYDELGDVTESKKPSRRTT